MNWILVATGFIVHLIFFYSIFDIYFTSPLVHGMTPHRNDLAAPARRLVLFVADGLRADKLFELDESNVTRAPFIRNQIEREGCWGVSHTRVPTESRPGHVALIAGFYEDVSAVAKGWKENPVEFDSVFNESRNTWSWGSPDILPMFSKGATGNHVAVHMYPGHSEDFAGADLTKLDTWVFDTVKEFFEKAAENETLKQQLHEDKLIFFLHLLGLDTSGHIKKPHSRDHKEHIGVVDRGVQNTVRIIEEFFGNDKRTAYIFTSDHGMTDWGSHGSGHPSETLTPLVAWGAGIRGPVLRSGDLDVDGLQWDWGLGHIRRSDVNQADVSPLMSVLIGVPISLQSVGLVPLDYLSSDLEFKSESLFTNALQILEQFEIKMNLVQSTTLQILYTPFKRLMPSDQLNEIRMIRKLINEKQFEESIKRSDHLIDLALEGLIYYHRYDRFFLGSCITVGYVGWMLYITILLLSQHSEVVSKYESNNRAKRNNKLTTYAFILIGTVVVLLLYVQSLRWSYYVYTLLPIVLWHELLQRRQVLRFAYWYIVDHRLSRQVLIGSVLWIAGLELIILSFFFRELLSIGLVFMALWPLRETPRSISKVIPVFWSLSCLFMAVFPFLPVVNRPANYPLIYVTGFAAVIIALVISFGTEFLTHPKKYGLMKITKARMLLLGQVVILLVSVAVVWSTVQSIDNRLGLPPLNQYLSWTISVLSVVVPLLCSSKVPARLLSIILSLFAPYLLLSTSFEVLFYLGLCVLMVFWISMEHATQSENTQQLLVLDFAEAVEIGHIQRKLKVSDLRCSYFFIFFLLLAFFGTGNIASINSFDPTSVLCFVTVFSPFIMGGLMLIKILIPFLLVTCTFNAVHLAVNVPTQSLFLLVLLMSDFMALHFFFLVKDHGSWLDIGSSISHYVIVMSIISFLFILLSIGKILTNWRLRLPLSRDDKFHEQ